MPLFSRRFRGDKALEGCAVVDAAHILLGAKGEHVGKIQWALIALDKSPIDLIELNLQKYGPSTARAVLAYKVKRSIVNPAYQTAADNIVGKMTIASLDREMANYEDRSRCVPGCGDQIHESFDTRGIRDSWTTNNPPQMRFPGNISVIWHVTPKAWGSGNWAQIGRANEILQPYGMFLNAMVWAIPYDGVVVLHDRSYAWSARMACERALPGLPKSLRVIVVPFSDSDMSYYGVTEGGMTFEGVWFPYFILLNARNVRPGNTTLLHEMIHAATGLTVADHDDGLNGKPADPDSLFSTNSARSVLRPIHAKALSDAFPGG